MSYLESFFKINDPIIGIDIGYQSLKMVQLNKKANPPKLIAFNSAPIPIKSMTGSDQNQAHSISSIVNQSLHSSKPRKMHGKLVVSGLPESRVFTKIIEMPHMDPKEMAVAIPHEASRHIPLPLSDIYLDYQALNMKTAHTESILVIAAPKKLVQKYVNVIQSAGLETIALETKPIAAGRALIHAGEENPILILDIGAEATGISIFDQGILKSTFTTPHGGYTFTKAIANFLNLDFDKAEKVKREFGITGKTKQGNLLTALEPILKDILEEIENAISFYEKRSQPVKKITEIRLCGGGANTRGLSEYLYAKMPEKIKVSIGNPFINLNQRSVRPVPPEEILHYTTAVGLALREQY